MRKKLFITTLATLSLFAMSHASEPYIGATNNATLKVRGINMGDVKWTNGFWKERFDMVMTDVVPAQYDYFMNFSENNFKIITEGIKDQGYKGTFWQDGDYYKWVEAQIAVYSVTKDPELLKTINERVVRIANSIADDGYSTTHVQIGYGVTGAQGAWTKHFKNEKRFIDAGHHETYNMGHLLVLACTHYRVTSDRTLLDAAIKVADYLDSYFAEVTPELSNIDFNPVQIMGLMELYRCTNENRYLELANRFISGRGHQKGATQNQNDTKLRLEDRAVGHAVLGPVLYIGAADYATETNDTELIEALTKIWEDMYTRKASFTGGLGNVHRGGSPTLRNATECVHEAFGKPYHLQNATAYNETCATYYGAYLSWRLFMLTGETKYVDVMERSFYNNLSAMQLDGRSYYYTNVLRWYGKSHNLLSMDYHQRWTEECACVCCPTSVARFLAESKEYAYAKDDSSLYVTLYGGNSIETEINGKKISFSQSTSYPWSDKVSMIYDAKQRAEFTLKLRIPKWAEGATLSVNGESYNATEGTFAEVNRVWKSGDKVELVLPMKPIINEANPMVEEVRNQVAISYGPLAYCVEGNDLPEGVSMDKIILPIDAKFNVNYESDLLGGVKTITTDAYYRNNSFDNKDLYAPIQNGYESFKLKLIPYYTWSNRGEHEMSVFIPLKW